MENVLDLESLDTNSLKLLLKDAMDKTAGSNMADIFHGFSDDPFNKYFASRRPDITTKQNRRTMG